MNEALKHISEIFGKISAHLNSQIIGQEKLINSIIITIFAGGHSLLE